MHVSLVSKTFTLICKKKKIFSFPVRNLSKELEDLLQPTKGRALVVSCVYELFMFIRCLCYFDCINIIMFVFPPSVEIMKADLIKELLASEGKCILFSVILCIHIYHILVLVVYLC